MENLRNQINLINLIIREILKEPEYYLENGDFFDSYFSQLQDSLQGELDNDGITEDQKHLLEYLNGLVKQTKSLN